ncbi:triosephosphate isomerase [Trichuris trichiura]|uniref:Triosephosphate isomerase n=1 Tax=Trichuris trichiura TaxID=36087 RepID=A0A077ZC84_TRITR|nr:triosephosphate isomerase [Trichuris trichiura]
MTTRKFIVGGNWKMNGDSKMVDGIVNFLNKEPLPESVDVVVAPPFPYLKQVRSHLFPKIAMAGQNCYIVDKGAFTGEVSAAMLKDIGCTWVILGHSERRHVLNESDAFIADKVNAALTTGLNVIYCVGETLQEREANKTKEVISRQMAALLKHKIEWTKVVIAYEPVWAIGTGKTATPEQAQEAHVWIRDWVKQNVCHNTGNFVRIMYGGSVTADNCRALAQKPDIDGFLVGGASLKPEFIQIVKAKV